MTVSVLTSQSNSTDTDTHTLMREVNIKSLNSPCLDTITFLRPSGVQLFSLSSHTIEVAVSITPSTKVLACCLWISAASASKPAKIQSQYHYMQQKTTLLTAAKHTLSEVRTLYVLLREIIDFIKITVTRLH